MMKVNLTERIVLVTGAAGGLDRGITAALAASGVRVVVADINLNAAREAASRGWVKPTAPSPMECLLTT
ncbi:MAG: hypothetical protein NTX51_13135 [Verrucomicrobia bacterium]|nr:hypothetical protein [Verrucomicrobiota bacterium]